MPANKLAIANSALSKIGSRAITSFIEASSNEARAINAVYLDVLDEVLSEHPWSFAQKRTALDYVVPDDVTRTIEGRVYPPVSITAVTKAKPAVVTAADHFLADGDRIKITGIVGMTQLNNNYYRVLNCTRNTFELIDEDTEAQVDSKLYTTYSSGGQIYLANDDNSTPLLITTATAANPVQITAAAHGFADGDWVYIHGVLGMTELNGNFYIVDNAATNTFTLQDTDEDDVDGSAYTAYTKGGQILSAPELPQTESGTIVVYSKPIDLVKATGKSSQCAFISIEEDKIISDIQSLKIKYTFRNTDPRTYFAKFTQALITRLASEIAFRLTNSVSKSSELLKVYHDLDLPSAVSVDSTQGTPDEARQDEWLNAQVLGSGNYPATTGQTWHPI